MDPTASDFVGNTDASSETLDTLTYAQFKFVKYAATFYHEAKKDGGLESYFILVNWLYYDRWPEESYEEIRAKLQIHIPPAALDTIDVVPSKYWRDALQIDYDRAHRNQISVQTAENYFKNPRGDVQNNHARIEDNDEEDSCGDVVDNDTLIDFGPALGPGWTYMEGGRGITGPFDFVFPDAVVIPYPWMRSSLPMPKKRRVINPRSGTQ